jgi:alkaline phosphatase/alkaline phosphatase D
MIGPDSNSKRDNHTNPKGFRHEGTQFFEWLKSNGFLERHFYVVCGDRHWQYHSRHPTGFEEFSCGALVDANAIVGIRPGAPRSSDPRAEIQQFYTQREASGGFLMVSVLPELKQNEAVLEFTFFDERGVLQYRHRKTARMTR